jgi:hypothetical protein
VDDLEHFQSLYEAFNRRDIDAVLAMMSDQVDSPNALKGGRLVGRQAVRDYWTAQWAEIDPHVEPLEITKRVDIGWPSRSDRSCAQSTGSSSAMVR